LAKLDRGEAPPVITDLREALSALDPARQAIVQREINYLDTHRQRNGLRPGQTTRRTQRQWCHRNQPAASTNVASNARANFGLKSATKPSCASKPSGATDAEIIASHLHRTLTPPKTEMRCRQLLGYG